MIPMEGLRETQLDERTLIPACWSDGTSIPALASVKTTSQLIHGGLRILLRLIG